MSNWSGFGDLDLSSVELGEMTARAPVLDVGKYTATCKEAKIEQVGDSNNRKLVLLFVDDGGAGQIRANLNIAHTSAQAQEIARRQLKSFLVAAGHKNPDQPGDVESMQGLKCEIVVGLAKPWTNRDGETIKDMKEVKYFNPLPNSGGEESANLDDDIPF